MVTVPGCSGGTPVEIDAPSSHVTSVDVPGRKQPSRSSTRTSRRSRPAVETRVTVVPHRPDPFPPS